MDTGFETRIDFSALNEKIGLLREQMARVIIGQRQVVDLLLTALLADGQPVGSQLISGPDLSQKIVGQF